MRFGLRCVVNLQSAARVVFVALAVSAPQQVYASATERPTEELRNLVVKAVNEAGSFRDRFEAEVWLMDMAGRLKKKIPDAQQRLELLKLVHFEATRVNLPPELVLAVIDVESNFNSWAISVVGARGLMQIMPFWLQEIGRPHDNLFRPEINVRMGCTILRHYMDKERGDLTRALGRYNGSLGQTKYPNLVFNAMRMRWFRQ